MSRNHIIAGSALVLFSVIAIIVIFVKNPGSELLISGSLISMALFCIGCMIAMGMAKKD